jgi:hypothetical protein
MKLWIIDLEHFYCEDALQFTYSLDNRRLNQMEENVSEFK